MSDRSVWQCGQLLTGCGSICSGSVTIFRVFPKGEQLTESLVKSLCDEELGTTRKRREKQLATSQTAAEVIKEIETTVKLWQSSLGSVPGEFWEDAELDDPGCCKRVSRVLSELASFLRS